MSDWRPCEKCGIWISKGLNQEQLCRRCSFDDNRYDPSPSLYDVDDKEGEKVEHRYLGKGVVEHCVASECRVNFEDESLVIDPRYLKHIKNN